MRVPQDFGEALKWFLRASRQGNAFAQACLGAMYRDGLGVAQDYREAGKWFRKSADQGDSTAQLALGILYKEGKGVPRDDEEALKWLNSAMEDRPAFPRGPSDYWNIPPILPSPITPIQIGEARRRVGEWKPKSWEALKREEEKRQPWDGARHSERRPPACWVAMNRRPRAGRLHTGSPRPPPSRARSLLFPGLFPIGLRRFRSRKGPLGVSERKGGATRPGSAGLKARGASLQRQQPAVWGGP